jgi:Predicted membrane protein (DUF2306)
MSRSRLINLLAGILMGGSIAAFGWVMATKIWPYMRFEHAQDFLSTKTDDTLAITHFQWAFYIHILSSWVVMMAGLVQMFPIVIRRWPRFHRVSGVVYLVLILILAAPSGFVLGWYANGGLAARVGFSLQSVVWWGVTLAAWYEISRHRFQAHADMMLRSYAITLAAMSLRTESYIMYYWFDTKPIETYLTVTWTSWVGNLLIAELLIYFGVGRWMIRQAMPGKRTI